MHKTNREEQLQPENTMVEVEQVFEIVRNLPASLLSDGVVFQGFCQVFFFSSLSIYKTTSYTLSLSLYRTSKSFHPSHSQSLQSFKHSKDYSL